MSPTSTNPILASGSASGWKVVMYTAVAIILLCIVSYFFLGNDILATLRIIFGLIYLLFLPGYILCWVIFPNNSEIDSVERVGLSFGLSIPLVLTWVLVLDTVFKVPLTASNIVLGLGALLGVLSAVGFARLLVTRKKLLKK